MTAIETNHDHLTAEQKVQVERIDKDRKDREDDLILILLALFEGAYSVAVGAVRNGDDPATAVYDHLFPQTTGPRTPNTAQNATSLHNALSNAYQTAFRTAVATANAIAGNPITTVTPVSVPTPVTDLAESAHTMVGPLIERINAVVDEAKENGSTSAETVADLKDAFQTGGYLPDDNAPYKHPYLLDAVAATQINSGYQPGLFGTWDNLPQVLGYEYVSILDDRTTDICTAYAGVQLFKNNPWWLTHFPGCHWNCRSTIIALFKPFVPTAIPPVDPPPMPGFGMAPAGFVTLSRMLKIPGCRWATKVPNLLSKLAERSLVEFAWKNQDLIELDRADLTGGEWRTIRGAKVYIKDGKIEAGPAHLIGRTKDEAETAVGPGRGGKEGSRVTWRGHSMVGVIRHAAAKGLTAEETEKLLPKLGMEASPKTIGMYHRFVRSGRDAPPELTEGDKKAFEAVSAEHLGTTGRPMVPAVARVKKDALTPKEATDFAGARSERALKVEKTEEAHKEAVKAHIDAAKLYPVGSPERLAHETMAGVHGEEAMKIAKASGRWDTPKVESKDILGTKAASDAMARTDEAMKAGTADAHRRAAAEHTLAAEHYTIDSDAFKKHELFAKTHDLEAKRIDAETAAKASRPVIPAPRPSDTEVETHTSDPFEAHGKIKIEKPKDFDPATHTVVHVDMDKVTGRLSPDDYVAPKGGDVPYKKEYWAKLEAHVDGGGAVKMPEASYETGHMLKVGVGKTTIALLKDKGAATAPFVIPKGDEYRFKKAFEYDPATWKAKEKDLPGSEPLKFPDRGETGDDFKKVDLAYRPPETVTKKIEERLGLSPEKRTEVEAKLKDLAAKAYLFRRTQIHDFAKVLKSGRFKSQFETGSSDGALIPSGRSSAEYLGLGVPKDIDKTKRPIYGYLHSEKHGGDTATSYGAVKVRLKPSVRPRVTMTVGDSLGPMGSGHQEGVPVNAPTIHTLSHEGKLSDVTKSKNIEDTAGSWGYAEAQYHGGLPVSDVEAVIVPKRVADHPEFKESKDLLKKMGIPLEIHG
jgi:Protein of unknown function (DUF3626)